MIIGFTGTSEGMNQRQLDIVRELIQKLPVSVLHHGDCIGADAQMHDLVKAVSGFIVIHPPKDDSKRAWCEGDITHPPLPYLLRNRAIVKAARDAVIAAPFQEREVLRGSGTWATIRYAKAANRHLYVVFPNGWVEWTVPKSLHL